MHVSGYGAWLQSVWFGWNLDGNGYGVLVAPLSPGHESLNRLIIRLHFISMCRKFITSTMVNNSIHLTVNIATLSGE